MVVFTCNHCGESLKKNAVGNHKARCRREISVGCMDCLKDFYGDSYNSHNQCMTEAERYSGKDYVPKISQNKGQRKQEAWVDMVRSISEKKANLSQGVKNILQTISSYDNIPRKKAKFLNFMKNSFRYMKVNELDEAWILLEEAMRENKNQSHQEQNGKSLINGKEAGEKRKLDNDSDEEIEKKKKKNEPENVVENGSDQQQTEKFDWSEVIRTTLNKKNNEINFTKLRKKVLNKYKKFYVGTEISDKLENKFKKKLKKINGISVDSEFVRLIE